MSNNDYSNDLNSFLVEAERSDNYKDITSRALSKAYDLMRDYLQEDKTGFLEELDKGLTSRLQRIIEELPESVKTHHSRCFGTVMKAAHSKPRQKKLYV